MWGETHKNFNPRLRCDFTGKRFEAFNWNEAMNDLKKSDESGDAPSEASGVWFDEHNLVDADDEEAPLATFITTDHGDSQ